MKRLRDKIQNIEYNNLYPLFFTIIFILILIQYSFYSLDAIFYDLWSRADILNKTDTEAVIVYMDEESDQFLGEVYPYTSATHYRFIEKIVADKPGAIGYLIPMLETNNDNEKNYLKRFRDKIDTFKLEGGVFRFGTNKDAWGEQLPPDGLSDLGYSLALINKDGNVFAKDEVTRRAILNFSGEDSFHLWMANKLRARMGKDRSEATSFRGAYYNNEADAIFSLFRYGSNPNSVDKIKLIPFHRVVVGNYPRGFFKNKLVLIGSKYFSNTNDFTNTPFGKDLKKAPKLNVHIQIIDSLIKGKTLYQVPAWVTDIIAVLIAAFLSLIISRVQPTKGLLITMGLMVIMFVVAYLMFTTIGVLVNLSHIILSVFVVYYIWVPFRAIGEYQSRYAIEEETKVLKKVDKLKQNFISLMSHDLKTPVAKIAGIADILRSQYTNNKDQENLLDNVIQSTKELNNFISSILDLTKIESQNFDLRMESKDINPLIESTINTLRFEANAKRMKIHKDLEPLYPIQLDVVLINRVIGNLVGNAIKYAGEDKEIFIKSWDDEKWVYVEIKDNGKGIKSDDLENIFEKFYRVKNDENHQIKGSGLGLYLVKYFVELHKGEIEVSSQVGVGTTFLIKLINK
ncbi:MAG: CHASE2 and HATPase_c domain-containing protein [Bacteriovoracaceae bacterium]|jgi:signal transduction histidine kinase|nr:CHASE2 and HATPase_c domain-containing protein [Bacteriovoracaceae bacterium]